MLYNSRRYKYLLSWGGFTTNTTQGPLLSKKTCATLLLCIAALGAVLTYGRDSIILRLIFHGCTAAVIGGLADWFAITALFRKPLGFISIRSEVLPKNRERIMNELVDFISKDLLNPEYIIASAKRYNLAQMFIDYCNANGGSGRVRTKAICRELAERIIVSADAQKIGTSLALAFKGRRDNFNMARILIQFLLSFIKTENGGRFIDCLIRSVRDIIPKIINDDFAKKLLDDNVTVIKKRYAKDKQMRGLMFDIVDLSGSNLRGKLLAYVDDYSKKLLDPDSPERAKLLEYLAEKIELLGKRDGYKHKVQQLEHYFFVKKFDFSSSLVTLIDRFRSSEGNRAALLAEVDSLIDEQIDLLSQDEHRQAKFNDYLLSQGAVVVKEKFPDAVAYIRRQLMGYTNEQFVELVESRVGDDLQMIRINGSLIGGAAGIGLYLITLAVERLCSL